MSGDSEADGDCEERVSCGSSVAGLSDGRDSGNTMVAAGVVPLS